MSSPDTLQNSEIQSNKEIIEFGLHRSKFNLDQSISFQSNNIVKFNCMLFKVYNHAMFTSKNPSWLPHTLFYSTAFCIHTVQPIVLYDRVMVHLLLHLVHLQCTSTYRCRCRYMYIDICTYIYIYTYM